MARPPEFDRTVALRQAMGLFWKQGYEATSVQALGAALGLNPGSLYNAFKDKHSLFLATLDCYVQTEHAGACKILYEQADGTAGIRQFFEVVVAASIADPDNRGCMMLNATAELAARDPEVRVRAEASRAAMLAMFRQALAAAQQHGEIAQERDLDTLAAFLVTTLYGLQMTAKISGDRHALLAIVDQALLVLR